MSLRPHRTCRLGTLTLVGVLVVGCSPGDPTKPPPPRHRLEGSVTALMDLGWDDARFNLTAEDLSLTFVRRRAKSAVDEDAGTTEDYPLKITYALLNDGPPSGGRLDLAELTPTGDPRAVISRYVLNDPRKTFPLIERGSLSMSRPLDANAIVSGEFNITFQNGLEATSGHTIFGKYDAKVIP